ncbi:hypothetical protein J1605_021246 [Eschrichtius robustus]|uniref:Uncharacterized protein n=1 Tax=Eschrichtius robustus TaxID=9764 RepID=A0AB34HEZ4_ESCRO|nr:hypothetical protein J1605_021246 [Eschrichtius robustus]
MSCPIPALTSLEPITGEPSRVINSGLNTEGLKPRQGRGALCDGGEGEKEERAGENHPQKVLTATGKRRWVRLLFGREFPLQDLLVVWDALFADGLSLSLVDYIFIAMLLYIRDACKC